MLFLKKFMKCPYHGFMAIGEHRISEDLLPNFLAETLYKTLHTWGDKIPNSAMVL